MNSDPRRRAHFRYAALRLAAVALVAAANLSAQIGDPFNVKVDPTAARVSPLRMATLVARDAAEARRFFVDGMRMRLAAETTPDDAKAEAQRRLWNLPASWRWTELRFDRPGVPDAIVVRVLIMDGGEPLRPDMLSRLQGGLSLGFPVANQKRLERATRRLGITSTVGITSINMPRGDGSDYAVEEIHYRGPEGLYALGVWRQPPLAPVGPIDARSGVGGPAYSGMVVVNADREIDFYRRVLGWEVRRDIELTTSGPNGGLALPEGTKYRFLQLFAPGSVTGYLVMLDFRDRSVPNPSTPRAPNRGLVAWSFETRDLDDVLQRIEAFPDARATLLARPVKVADGAAGTAARRVASVLTPNGLLLEIAEVLP